MKRFFRARFFLVWALAAGCLILIFHAPLLNEVSSQLVSEDSIIPCDAIVVLAGDNSGERMLEGLALFKKGYGKRVIFWAGPLYWKVTYAEVQRRMFQEAGVGWDAALYSEEDLTEFSTRGEARVNLRLMREQGLRSMILVTSDYHTGRARRVYASLVPPGIPIYIHPVHEKDIPMVEWWKNRKSAKIVLSELEKTAWYRLQDIFGF